MNSIVRVCVVAALMFCVGGCVIAGLGTNDQLDSAAFRGLGPGTKTALEFFELLGATTDVVQLG